ncbi:MAG: proton-conducting transporter membrane subunit, partial [Spirochaetes bacterium]|nr:proton-conducting transporter membrane subunit [Spirochaetota bacterium]
MTSNAVLLFTVIPLFGSFIALIEKVTPSFKVAKPIALGSFFLGVFLLSLFGKGIYEGAVYATVVGGWPTGIGIGQQLDGLAWVALALTYLIYLPVLLFSFSEGGYDSRFYFFLLLLQGGMAGIVLAYDVFNLFVFLEITGIAVYTLIAYQQKDRALFAGFKYLMLSSVGITLFLVGVFLFYRDTGSLQYETLREWVQASVSDRNSPSLTLGAAFALATLLAGIGVRTAFLPYTWLPDAHGFAPHPISASLSGVVIKVAFIVVWKIITLLQLEGAREFLLWMGSAIALIGVLRALTQTDVKVLLAWHSVSQMGYVFAGFGAGNEIAVTGSLYHMVSHAFFKALLFLSVGTVILFTGER